MNDRINELNKKLKKLSDEIYKVNVKIKAEYYTIFSDSVYLRDSLANLARSNQYILTIDHEIHSYIDFDFKRFTEGEKFLREWLIEQGTVPDAAMNRLQMYQGNCILIFGEGISTTDPNQKIIDAENYTDEKSRNQLIENWMQENGTFPRVFSVDLCDRVLPVDTEGEI